MKTNKHQTLLLVKNAFAVRAKHLVLQFNYSAGTARSYLSYLARQGLLERTTRGYVLSSKGRDRLQFFGVTGCTSFDCPICIDQKAGHFTCPRCEHHLPKKEAQIKPEWDFLVGVRNAGVYCPFCQKLIFTKKQAQLIGIPNEV